MVKLYKLKLKGLRMGTRMNNLKAFFSDARTRSIYIITFAILIVGVLAGYFIFREATTTPKTNVSIVNAPGGLNNEPGTTAPSAQYEKLLEQENLQKAKEAKQTGGSAIPTIIRESDVDKGQLAQLPNIASNLTPLQMALNDVTRNGCDPKALQQPLKLEPR